MTLGDTGFAVLAAGPGGASPLENDHSGWASGIWGPVAVPVILALAAILVVSVRRGSCSDDEE